MQLIHLSDLHYSSGNSYQKELIKAFFEDISQLKRNGLAVDFVVFSGDIVNNPDEAGIYDAFFQTFMKPLLEIISLRPTRVIYCPGNHDVSLKTMDKKSLLYDSVQKALVDQVRLAESRKGGQLSEYIRSLSSRYFSFVQSQSPGSWQDPLAHLYSFDDLSVSFVALNSAFGCCKGGSVTDRGRLAFPCEVALSAFQSIPAGHRVISLTHHTMSDFNETTSRLLAPMIASKASLHCFGHVHQPAPSTSVSPSGRCFFLQGGALYEKSGNYLGYAVARFSDTGEHISAEYRSYYPDRFKFDIGTNVEKLGTFYNEASGREYWANSVALPPNSDVCAWLLESVGALDPGDSTITRKSLTETFVEPNLVKPEVVKKPLGTGALETRYRVAQLIRAPEHFVIAADYEYGATSLMRHLQFEFHRECAALPEALVPVLLDARRLKAYPANISGALRGGLPETSDPRMKLAPLHESGRLVVLVDDFDPSNIEHRAMLEMLNVSYPKARIIVAAKLPLFYADGVLPIVGISEFSFVQMRPLNRTNVRQLIEKWKLPESYNTDLVLNEISTRFRELGVPLTPVYVVVYLSILEDIKGFNPINLSTIIEQFVENVLEKYKPAYAFRSSFDYKNQIDYLAVIAEKMCRKNEFMTDYEELYEWTRSYFDDIAMEHDYQKLLQHFIDNKIFSYEANKVYFRYNIFLSFFIGYRIQRNIVFRDWILHDRRFMSYINELDIYFGLSRNDSDGLEVLAAEFAKFSAELAVIVDPLAWTQSLDSLQLPPMQNKDRNQYVDAISKKLLTSNVPAADRDAEVGRGEKEKDVRPDLHRAEVTGVVANWIMSLRAYSVAVKNLENIPRSKKEEHLAKVLNGWGTVMRYACLLFRDFIETKELTAGGLKFKLGGLEKLTVPMIRLLFIAIPVVISQFLRADLGSQKLSVLLRDENLSADSASAFLQTGLYADMKLTEYLPQLGKLRRRMAESQFFLEAMLLKMRDLYTRFGLTAEEQKPFRKLAAEISADLKGLKGQDRSKHMSDYANELDRNEQLVRLREAAK
jgi:predicted phosphodiesterase